MLVVMSGNWRTAAAQWSKTGALAGGGALLGGVAVRNATVTPKTHVLRITDLSDEQRDSLALALKN